MTTAAGMTWWLLTLPLVVGMAIYCGIVWRFLLDMRHPPRGFYPRVIQGGRHD